MKCHYRTENINAEEKNKVRNKKDTNKNLKFASKIQMKSQILNHYMKAISENATTPSS